MCVRKTGSQGCTLSSQLPLWVTGAYPTGETLGHCKLNKQAKEKKKGEMLLYQRREEAGLGALVSV